MKKGIKYQNLVGSIMKALYQSADIKINSIIKGPDGCRDIDVEVRGNLHNGKKFLFIECKDWNKPVGICVLDIVDSKSRDLNADEVIVFSNSGFTKEALNKALRLNIKLCSALKNNSSDVKIKIYKKIVAKLLSIEKWQLTIYPVEKDFSKIPKYFDPEQLRLNKLPVINWLSKISKEILTQLISDKLILNPKSDVMFKCVFKKPEKFFIDDLEIFLKGLTLKMNLIRKFLYQIVPVDVSLGLYDYLNKKIIVPDKESYLEGPINMSKWQELEKEDDGDTLNILKEGEFSLEHYLLNYIKPIENFEIPDIDDLISEKEINICN